MRPYQARRFPQWIRRALNLTETVVPASLFSQRDEEGIYSPIFNTLDTFQGGLGIGDPIVCNTTALVAAGPIAQLVDIPNSSSKSIVVPTDNPPADANNGYIIFALSISLNAAATRTPWFYITPVTPFSGAVGLVICDRPQTVAAGLLSSVDLFNSNAPFWCPPGWYPCCFTNDMIAGETMTVQASLMRIPAGFKPY